MKDNVETNMANCVQNMKLLWGSQDQTLRCQVPQTGGGVMEWCVCMVPIKVIFGHLGSCDKGTTIREADCDDKFKGTTIPNVD